MFFPVGLLWHVYKIFVTESHVILFSIIFNVVFRLFVCLRSVFPNTNMMMVLTAKTCSWRLDHLCIRGFISFWMCLKTEQPPSLNRNSHLQYDFLGSACQLALFCHCSRKRSHGRYLKSRETRGLACCHVWTKQRLAMQENFVTNCLEKNIWKHKHVEAQERE